MDKSMRRKDENIKKDINIDGKESDDIDGIESNDENSSISLKSLGIQISTVRKMINCTQVLFANAIGITPQTMSLIERGGFTLTNNLAAKIYFSLAEIMNDNETLYLLELEKYQIMCIQDLMENLRSYISSLNSDLKQTVTDIKNVEIDN